MKDIIVAQMGPQGIYILMIHTYCQRHFSNDMYFLLSVPWILTKNGILGSKMENEETEARTGNDKRQETCQEGRLSSGAFCTM